MSKQIKADELAEIITKLLTCSDADCAIDEKEVFGRFMTEVAQVVCDHCGGEVLNPASSMDGRDWYVGVHANDSSPDDGGVWSEYDPDGDFTVMSDASAYGPRIG